MRALLIVNQGGDRYIKVIVRLQTKSLIRQVNKLLAEAKNKEAFNILFKKAQIILMDVPTSNVDPKAEEEIFANIIDSTRDQIVVLVSHRFSTVRRADKIILLEGGIIAEEGSHKSLIKNKGKYAHLFNLQAKSYQ